MKAGSLKPLSGSVSARDGAASEKSGRSGQLLWKLRIESGDTSELWGLLTRLIMRHPLVRGRGRGSDGKALLPDLVQDLYLDLLGKNRFEHYVAADLTDEEIEREIWQVELPRLVLAKLRRERPENYRLARRIGRMLATDDHFRVFAGGKVDRATFRRRGETLYGLREWPTTKPVSDGSEFLQRLAEVPVQKRNRRRIGRSGDTQLVIGNRDLVTLLVLILEAIDSPAPLRVLRQLAMAKIPIHDAEITSLDKEDREGGGRGRTPRLVDLVASSEANPESLLLLREDASAARQIAQAFLDRLALLMRFNQKRIERILFVLWHLYFNPVEPTQAGIAAIVGLSDSSIGDYRRRLESELRRLELSPDLTPHFTEALEQEICRRLFALTRSEAAGDDEERSGGRSARESRQLAVRSFEFRTANCALKISQ